MIIITPNSKRSCGVVNSGLKVIMLDLTARLVLRLLKSILRDVRVLTAIHP